jgi:hypothetical protein
MAFDNTQLTMATGYDVNRMIFGKPRDGSIPNSTVTFKRIPIGTRNPDGTLGELIIPTSRVYSFGLSPNTNMNTGKVDGYSISLCLFNRDAPSVEERAWVDTFNKIVEHIKEYLLAHRDDIEKYELEPADLKKLNPLYYKKEKGKIVEGAGPVLYPKVLQNKKNDAITTFFVDEKGNDIDPMSLLEKACLVTAAVKIESIFVGAKISLQIKVHEAEVKMFDNAPKRLLRRPTGSSEVVMESSHISSNAANVVLEEYDEDDDAGSVKADDDDESATPAAPAAAQPVAAAPAKAAAPRRVARKA